jgi:hypothetical protein
MIANPAAREELDSGAFSRRSGRLRSSTPDVMTADDQAIKFRSLAAGPSGGWRVEIRIGADHVRYIYGFDSQFDADEWIEREAEEWMKLLGADR